MNNNSNKSIGSKELKEEILKLLEKVKELDNAEPKDIIDIARKKAELFKIEKIKINQIRNFYSAVLSIKNTVERQKNFSFEEIELSLMLLKPRIAYAAGKKKEVRILKEFIDILIDKVLQSNEKEKSLKNFFIIIESVVAYHKFYESNG